MRPTLLGIKSPKDRTEGLDNIRITASGSKLDYSASIEPYRIQCIHKGIKHHCSLWCAPKQRPIDKTVEVPGSKRRPASAGRFTSLECKPCGPTSFTNEQRFQEFKQLFKRQPDTMGPGKYDISRAASVIGTKRKDYCIANMKHLSYGGKEAGNPGFFMVGNSVQFDEQLYLNYQRGSPKKESKHRLMKIKMKLKEPMRRTIIQKDPNVENGIQKQKSPDKVSNTLRSSELNPWPTSGKLIQTEGAPLSTGALSRKFSASGQDLSTKSKVNQLSMRNTLNKITEGFPQSPIPVRQKDVTVEHQLQATKRSKHVKTATSSLAIILRNKRNQINSVRSFLHQKSNRLNKIIDNQFNLLMISGGISQSTDYNQKQETVIPQTSVDSDQQPSLLNTGSNYVNAYTPSQNASKGFFKSSVYKGAQERQYSSTLRGTNRAKTSPKLGDVSTQDNSSMRTK